VGSGEWGVGSGDWGVGSGDWGLGTGEWGVGTGEWEKGFLNLHRSQNFQQSIFPFFPRSPIPNPQSPVN